MFGERGSMGLWRRASSNIISTQSVVFLIIKSLLHSFASAQFALFKACDVSQEQDSTFLLAG